MYRVRLSEEQREELKRRARGRQTAPRTRERLEMVRLCDAGWSVPRIARHLRMSEVRVRHWVRRFLAGGLDALPDEPHLGQPSALTPAILESVRAALRASEQTWTAQQIADWIAAEHGVRRSADRVRRMLGRGKLSYQRTHRHVHHKQKPAEVAAKKEELAAHEKRGLGSGGCMPPRRSRLCLDPADDLQLGAGGGAAPGGL